MFVLTVTRICYMKNEFEASDRSLGVSKEGAKANSPAFQFVRSSHTTESFYPSLTLIQESKTNSFENYRRMR